MSVELQSDAGMIEGEPSPPGEAQRETKLEQQFVSPQCYVWKLQNGRELELWPICNGGELLFNRAIDAEDSNITVVLIWIFIHLKRGITLYNAKGEQTGVRDAIDAAEDLADHVVDMVSDRKRFRTEFLRWLDSLGRIVFKDKQAAVKLFDDAHEFAKRSAVVPVPEAGQKKIRGSARRKRRS